MEIFLPQSRKFNTTEVVFNRFEKNIAALTISEIIQVNHRPTKVRKYFSKFSEPSARKTL